MFIQLNDDRKAEISHALAHFFKDQFDEDPSDFRALEIVDFMLH